MGIIVLAILGAIGVGLIGLVLGVLIPALPVWAGFFGGVGAGIVFGLVIGAQSGW